MRRQPKWMIIETIKQMNATEILFERKYGWLYKPWEHCEESIYACCENLITNETIERITLPLPESDLVIFLNEKRFIAKWKMGTESIKWDYDSITSIEKSKDGFTKLNRTDGNSFNLSKKDLDPKIQDKFIKFIKIKIGELEPEPDPNTLGLESLAILRDAELEKVREKYKKGEISEREFKKEEEKLSNIFDFRLSLKKD